MRDLPRCPMPGRRSVLAGIVGSAALVLAGCGLRLDRDPEPPAPGPDDTLRNEVATLLAGIRAQGRRAKAVRTLAGAVGPVWTAPAATASPSASPAAAHSGFTPGLTKAVEAVTGGIRGGALAPVLADVGVGAALALVTLAQADATALGKRFTKLAGADGGAAQGASASAQTTDGGLVEAPPEDPLATFARICYQASAGYERIAAALPTTDAYRRFAIGRGEGLDLAAATANGFLTAQGLAAPANKPAWSFSTKPSDLATGQTLARSLEDSVATALPALLSDSAAPKFACAQLWASGWARHRAGGAQLLRFTYTGQTPSASPGGNG